MPIFVEDLKKAKSYQFLWCELCESSCSANYADYFWKDKHTAFICDDCTESRGENIYMVLAQPNAHKIVKR